MKVLRVKDWGRHEHADARKGTRMPWVKTPTGRGEGQAGGQVSTDSNTRHPGQPKPHRKKECRRCMVSRAIRAFRFGIPVCHQCERRRK